MDKDVIQIQIYFKTADEVETGNPVTAHYIRAYAINKALELYKTKQTQGQDISEIKKNLETWFKDTEFKKQLINPALLSDKIKNQKDFLNFVLLLFKEADDEYRDETYTAQTALSFHRCSMLFDAYSIFGELDNDTKNKRKYAKLKMLEIRKNIQNGFVPKKREEVSIEQIEKNLISYGNNEASQPSSDVRTSMMSNNFSSNNYSQNINQFNPVNQSSRIESTGASGNPYGNQGGYPGSTPFGGVQQSQNIKQSQNVQPNYNSDDNLFDPKHQNNGFDGHSNHPSTIVYQSSIQGSRGEHASNVNPYQSSFNPYNTPTVPTTHITTQVTPDIKAPSQYTTNPNIPPTNTSVPVPSGGSASFGQPPITNIQPKLPVPLVQSDIGGNQPGRTTGRTAVRRDPEFLKKCQEAKTQLQKGISELDYRRVPQAIDNVKAALLALQELLEQ